ncbi:hypothetical protein A4X09_0g3542 [Tilletia walkeri]|uniref:Eukaryotic translation initiation factor 3 subunit M n=1 Tax=Tilletia walkeri TaxID=117179 RepID=A0A8X7NAG8_9BASI|nr:hypothetical protein A4X09_0g3542 [Tilletia walkeri]
MASEQVAAGASIVADSVTVLVDGAFQDHILELTPFLARALPQDHRQAFTDNVRSNVSPEEGDAFENDPQKRIEVLSIIVNALKTLPEPATDRELEGAFNLLLTLILTSPAASASSSSSSSRTETELSKEQTELLSRLAEVVGSSSSASATDKSIAKYRILTNFFNALPSRSPVRLTIFLSLLSLAAHSDDLDILSSASAYVSSSSSSSSTSAASVLLYSLPAWLAQWSLDEGRKQEVLKQVADILLKQTDDATAAGDEADPSAAARTLAFHKLYLRFLDAASTEAGDASTSAAETTVALALRLPHVFDFPSLLESRAILGLEKSNAPLWTLLVEVVLAPGGRGQRFESWKAKNGGLLSKIGVQEAVLVRKIRLLDIASLCAAQVYSDTAAAAAAAAAAAVAAQQQPTEDTKSPAEVAYSLIASSALPSEPAEDVETWVIDVIRAGLVSGKLSQVNEVFRVYRVSSVIPLVEFSASQKGGEGVFSRKQWEVLEVKLGAWRESISRMLETLGAAAKQQQVSNAAAQAVAQAQAGSEQQQQQQQHASVQQAQAVN